MMGDSYRYEIILYWSKADQAFIAEVPELPGCAADGATANGEPSPFVEPLRERLAQVGYQLTRERVPYEFQPGGNEIPKVVRQDGGATNPLAPT
jgi:hypothetical protein